MSEQKAEKALTKAVENLTWARWNGTSKELEECAYLYQVALRDYCKSIGDHACAFAACPVTRII